MKTLELREGSDTKTVHYEKVVNPDNPSEFLYVESNYLAALAANLKYNGLASFGSDLLGGVVGAIGGLVTGGPIAAIGGAIAGFTKSHNNKPQVAVSPSANGQSSFTVTAPSSALVPAVIAPPPPEKKDNTLLYIVAGGLTLLVLPKLLK